MERDKIVDLLASISSKFKPTTSQEKKRIEELQKSLASAMLSQNLAPRDSSLRKIGKLKIEAEDVDREKLQEIVKNARPSKKEDQVQVELRNSNFSIDLLATAKQKGSIEKLLPAYSGIRKLKSEGPFPGIEGMDWSIDYYPYFTKLNSIYIEGQSLPAILFQSRVFKFPLPLRELTVHGNLEHVFGKEYKDKGILGKIGDSKPIIEDRKTRGQRIPGKNPSPSPTKKGPLGPIKQQKPSDIIEGLQENTRLYQAIANTVWVRANLLSPSAPSGHYCALRVKNGTVFLDRLPISEDGAKIIVNQTTTITVNLNLEQSNPELPANENFGTDAREAKYKLPTKFVFNIKNISKTIVSVSNIECEVYGSKTTLEYKNSQDIGYNESISSVTVPVNSNKPDFSIKKCKSNLIDISGEAPIQNSYWTVFTHAIDIEKPLEADGNGALAFECKEGLNFNLKNTEETLSAFSPFIFLQPKGILFKDEKSRGKGFQRDVSFWKDEVKPFGTTATIKYRDEDALIYSCLSPGEENLAILADIKLHVDRPVKVDGQPVSINSKKSILMFRGKGEFRSIYIMDVDLLKDNDVPSAPNHPEPDTVEPIAFALQNALFTVTPPVIISFFGKYDEDFLHVYEGELTTYFGIFKYIPTLPDPYAADIKTTRNPNPVKSPFNLENLISVLQNITSWKKDENVSTQFKFGNSDNSDDTIVKRISRDETNEKSSNLQNLVFDNILKRKIDVGTEYKRRVPNPLPTDRGKPTKKRAEIDGLIGDIGRNLSAENRFSLLDVSSKANQLGVSFKPYERPMRTSGGVEDGIWKTALKIDNLDVVAQGISAQAFMLPQISWEPTFNLSEQTDGSPLPNDPPRGFNYYPIDGISTLIGNYSKKPVAISPIPLSKYLEDVYRDENNKITYALFNLPFGMVGLSILDNQSGQSKTLTLKNIAPSFNGNINGGIQLELTAGNSFAAEGDLFQGITIQIPFVLDMGGQHSPYSTLGSSVHQIFAQEFTTPEDPDDITRPAVPLEKIGLSGYGASIFSNWHNKNATFAATSQATFNVATGRTMHEVVQVKSVIYPWGIFVVRTITILRLNNGYVMRMDSGWQAESDGKFYYGIERDGVQEPNPYEFHAGLVKGLYNIRNIRENDMVYDTSMTIKNGDYEFNESTNEEVEYTDTGKTLPVAFQGLTFDADIDIEGVIEGQNKNKRVPSKGVLGFVQLKPRGTPIKPDTLSALLDFQNGSIGGPVDCTLKIAGTNQYMKINRVDVNNSLDDSNQPIFVAAARGSVMLPKEGSWTMVTHQASDGTVTPLDKDMSVPLIRKGRWDFGRLLNSIDEDNLQRIAHPSELLRAPDLTTINFGILQNLDTQKVLYLTPSFKKGVKALLSKTPPLMADGYKLLQSTGIFPDIGDAVNDFGKIVPLLKGKLENGTIKDLFKKAEGVKDGVKEVYELLHIAEDIEAGKLVDQGYQLLKRGLDGEVNKLLNFDFPSGDYDLINNENFKIVIKYKADKPGKLDYNLDSLADDLEDQWRGRLNNVTMVVSLGPFDDLMKVKGNFNNQKGKESSFGGEAVENDGAMPTAEIEFSDAIEPVIQILEILQDVSGGDYQEAFKKGLKVAMSNSANIWEYKYEASKEIGMVRFPPAPLYDSPQTPLKLEASLSIGFYFNAALKITDDPKDLLPSAGAFFLFHGGLQVMCVSVAAATIYAIGNVDLKLSADTSPQLAVDMKFGFGAQLAVGLPVVGNVSIQFMISVEIHASTGGKVAVAAMMMFRGHAEIFGGIIGVTITIEAKGTIEKSGNNTPTNCRASVSFGLDISVAFIINISFHETWEETKQIA